MNFSRRRFLFLSALAGTWFFSGALHPFLGARKEDTPLISLRVEDGHGSVQTFQVPGSTPLTSLFAAGLVVQAEGRPGGTLVHAIGEIANTQREHWHLVVNGRAPLREGADYKLEEGDVVEWRYL